MKEDLKSDCGILTMAATHIGCIEDTPQRTLAALKNADLLIFEEDRPARALLKMAGIHKSYVKYNEHHPSEILEILKKELKAGKHAVYVSDQGCPTLADPGKRILETAYAAKAIVKVIPGPSSITAALSACPFNVDQFLFRGFLSAETVKRERELAELKEYRDPIIVLDTPYRMEKLLQTCEQIFDKNRRAFLAVDISGEQENYFVGSFAKLRQASVGMKLNFVLIIDRSKS